MKCTAGRFYGELVTVYCVQAEPQASLKSVCVQPLCFLFVFISVFLIPLL